MDGDDSGEHQSETDSSSTTASLTTVNMASSSSNVKVVRPKRLTEKESLTTFEDWRNNLEFFLQQDKDFANLLKSNVTWSKASENRPHRGLDNADEERSLKQFLGVIASLSTPLLHNR